jgi:hypothetical protein
MTLYISAARRQRRAIAWAIVVGLVAFLLGLLLGRQQVPSIDDRIASVQRAASEIASGVERLDIEYEQALSTSGSDTVAAGVVAPLDGLRTRLQQTMDRAPWLAPSQRQALLDSVAELRSGALERMALDDFRSRSHAIGDLVRATFGVA